MNNKLTDMVFILDRSGSMAGMESDTIGGFNSLLEKQKNEQGNAKVTTVLFDDQYEVLHERMDINSIKPITEKEYYVRGCTALLDAIGLTINKISKAIKHTVEQQKPQKVMFVIITDGMENSSREFDYKKVKKSIEFYKKENQWEFLFIGANMDAIKTANMVGIGETHATNYCADGKGVGIVFDAIGKVTSKIRQQSAPISAEWKKDIALDYEKRK